jgi:hypothetical protein
MLRRKNWRPPQEPEEIARKQAKQLEFSFVPPQSKAKGKKAKNKY